LQKTKDVIYYDKHYLNSDVYITKPYNIIL